MYRLTKNPDVVLCIDTQTWLSRGSWLWDAYEVWLGEGNTPMPIPLPYEPNTPAHHRSIRDAAWEWMTSVVQARDYDTIESCCSYYNSGVERYRLEARAMVAWRDAVNEALISLVINPPPGIETWDQVRVLLPQPGAFPWPPLLELPLDGVPPITIPLD